MHRSGWTTFSSVVLIIAGVMRVIDGIWAFRNNGPVVDNLHSALFGHSLTTYGWVWLIVGILLIAAGVLVLNPSGGLPTEILRWFAIVAAGIEAVSAVVWMPYYPVWSITYVALAMAVIYGLAAGYEGSTSSA
jgi:hypothetical protein